MRGQRAHGRGRGGERADDSGRRTHEPLVVDEEVLGKAAREDEVVDLLGRARKDGVHRDLGVVLALAQARARRRLPARGRRSRSSRGGRGRAQDVVGRDAVALRLAGAARLGRRAVARRQVRVRQPPDVVDHVVRRVAREERGERVLWAGMKREVSSLAGPGAGVQQGRTLACSVEIWIALGMMSAVIFLSMRTISENGRTSWQRRAVADRHVSAALGTGVEEGRNGAGSRW